MRVFKNLDKDKFVSDLNIIGQDNTFATTAGYPANMATSFFAPLHTTQKKRQVSRRHAPWLLPSVKKLTKEHIGVAQYNSTLSYKNLNNLKCI